MINWQDLQIFLEVARTQRLSDAAHRLSMNHSTVSRRIRRFESKLNTQLFEHSTQGYRLTVAGVQLQRFSERMGHEATGALESIRDQNLQLSGPIRLGVTEGFGTHVVTPLLSAFTAQHPEVSIELLALPRVVSLSRHEADLAIIIDRPKNNEMVVSRLCDYRLRLYGQKNFLKAQAPITSKNALAHMPMIGYVDDLVFSNQLCYLDPLVSSLPSRPAFTLRSTSVITQLHAVRAGMGLAILPCFMASQEQNLEVILEDEIGIVRSFWIAARSEQRELLRVRLLWQFLRQAVATNQDFLMGEPKTELQLPTF